MQERFAKTLEHYRGQCQRVREYHAACEDSPDVAFEEIASIVVESLAVTGSPQLFNEVEVGVHRIVLRDLRHFKRTGRREFIYPHAGKHRDGGPEARAAIATLVAARLVPESMANIAVPPPMLTGLELIHGADALRERLACDDSLLDVELVALAQQVPNPRAYPDCWTMSLLMTEHERRDIDERLYERVPLRSFIATFALRGNVSLYFWPRFSFGFVYRLRVVRELRCRGQSAFQIKLDLHGKGRLHCREMALLRIEEISSVTDASTS